MQVDNGIPSLEAGEGRGREMSLYIADLTVLHFLTLQCPSEEAFLGKKATQSEKENRLPQTTVENG